MGSGDRCSNCGSTLAVDQRYCVECGLRRGRPRFAIAGTVTQDPPAASAAIAVRGAGGWSRVSAILAVIAVLLAIGVGVLIGTATQSSIRQPVRVVVSGGSLSGGGGSSTAGSGGQTTAKSGSTSSSSTTCTKGTAGCKNGKQTGNFFGG